MNVRRVAVLLATAAVWLVSSAAADDGLSLKYKLNKGDKFIYRSISQLKQTQVIMGVTRENEMNSEAINTVTIDGIDEKGNYQLTLKAERLKFTGKFAFVGDYAFDSRSTERDKSSMIGAVATPLFERLSGMMYQATVGPNGDVLEVRGYAEQLKDLLEANPEAAPFVGGGSNESAKLSLKELFVKFPDKALKPGDSWDNPSDAELPRIGATKGKSTYRLVGTTKFNGQETAKVEVTSEGWVDLNVEQTGVKITGRITSISSTGTMHFDLATGRVVHVEGNSAQGGDLSLDVNGTIIPMRQDQSMKATAELLEKLPE